MENVEDVKEAQILRLNLTRNIGEGVAWAFGNVGAFVAFKIVCEAFSQADIPPLCALERFRSIVQGLHPPRLLCVKRRFAMSGAIISDLRGRVPGKACLSSNRMV